MKRLQRTASKLIIKTCGCGMPFTRAQWLRLPLVGRTSDKVERAELRNCHACDSTLYLGTPRANVFYRTETAPGGFLVFRRAGVEEVMLRHGDVGAVHKTKRSVKETSANQRQLDRHAGKRLAVDVVVTMKGAK